MIPTRQAATTLAKVDFMVVGFCPKYAQTRQTVVTMMHSPGCFAVVVCRLPRAVHQRTMFAFMPDFASGYRFNDLRPNVQNWINAMFGGSGLKFALLLVRALSKRSWFCQMS